LNKPIFGVVAGDVDQQHFGSADGAGGLFDEFSSAIDDAHVKGLLDLPKP
jgi:hypothetical protein